MNFLQQLREKAEKATSGPWKIWISDEFSDTYSISTDPELDDVYGDTPYQEEKDDAQYIAMANPQTMLWLLDVVDEMIREVPTLYAGRIYKKLAQGPNPQKDGE